MTGFGAEFTESSVEADGFRIRYCEAGQGKPLVCLHGGGGLRLSRTHEILAEERRVIAFEVPGFGGSPVNERSATLDDLAATMNRAIDGLGIDRHDLMGTSFGAKLALFMALARPEAVEAAVLLSPAAIRLELPPGAAAPVIGPETLYAHPERQPEIAPDPPEIHDKQRALVGRLIGPRRDRAFEERLAALGVPVLAVFGTEDVVTPPEAARLYREILPNCHLVMVYDAAHAVDADRPEAVASLVADFLVRRESFLVREESDLIHP